MLDEWTVEVAEVLTDVLEELLTVVELCVTFEVDEVDVTSVEVEEDSVGCVLLVEVDVEAEPPAELEVDVTT